MLLEVCSCMTHVKISFEWMTLFRKLCFWKKPWRKNFQVGHDISLLLVPILVGVCVSWVVKPVHFNFVGVVIPGGLEGAIHAVCHSLSQFGNVTLLKNRHENCLNECSHTVFLSCVHDEISHWLYWCYNQPAELHFGHRCFLASTGVTVQQGNLLVHCYSRQFYFSFLVSILLVTLPPKVFKRWYLCIYRVKNL